MNKILHIDTDLQLPNRIHKSDTDNKVRQITDKAQNIAFVQTDPAKQPVYNYGGYYSFDGVNDVVDYPKMFYDFSKPNYTLFLLVRPTNLAKNQTIMACRNGIAGNNTFFTLYQANTTGLYSAQVRINGTVIYGTTRTVPVVENQWNTIVLTVADNQASLIINGKMAGSAYGFTHSGFSIPDLTVQPTQIGNEFNRAGWYFVGDIAYIKMEQKDYPEWQQRIPDPYAMQFADGATVFDDTFLRNSGFTHFKRYPDNGTNKLFISSKYLKGAVIDSENRVSKIYSSINNTRFLDNVGTNNIITKSGFTTEGVVQNYLRLAVDESSDFFLHLSTKDFFFSTWFYTKETKANQIIGNFSGVTFRYNQGTTNGKFFQYNQNGNVLTTRPIYLPNQFHHVAYLRISGVVHILINGVYEGSVADNYDYPNLSYPVSYGGIVNYAFNGYVDDLLISIGDSIIDPTGSTVGQKVFEPPRRGDFDGTIKQY